MSFFAPRQKMSDSQRKERESVTRQPRIFASWNVNSMGSRLKTEADRESLMAWIKEEAPDVLTLQEIKHAAASISRRGEMANKTAVQMDYCGLFSKFKNDLNADRAGKGYDVFLTLKKDGGAAGQAILIRKDVQMPKLSYSFDDSAQDQEKEKVHEDDGRIIVAAFTSLTVLSTYSPNNGGDAACFARRAQWDSGVKDYLTRLIASDRQCVWMGDLNSCTDEHDVSGDPNWWMKHKMGSGRDQEKGSGNEGQAGFTANERSRFNNILKVTGLKDPYRTLHGNPDKDNKDTGKGPFYTWRGSKGEMPGYARYEGKGMRIDYTLVTPALMDYVERAEITGRLDDRMDPVGFFGSDHCPVVLGLRDTVGGGMCKGEALEAANAACKRGRDGDGDGDGDGDEHTKGTIGQLPPSKKVASVMDIMNC